MFCASRFTCAMNTPVWLPSWNACESRCACAKSSDRKSRIIRWDRFVFTYSSHTFKFREERDEQAGDRGHDNEHHWVRAEHGLDSGRRWLVAEGTVDQQGERPRCRQAEQHPEEHRSDRRGSELSIRRHVWRDASKQPPPLAPRTRVGTACHDAIPSSATMRHASSSTTVSSRSSAGYRSNHQRDGAGTTKKRAPSAMRSWSWTSASCSSAG